MRILYKISAGLCLISGVTWIYTFAAINSPIELFFGSMLGTFVFMFGALSLPGFVDKAALKKKKLSHPFRDEIAEIELKERVLQPFAHLPAVADELRALVSQKVEWQALPDQIEAQPHLAGIRTDRMRLAEHYKKIRSIALAESN